MGGSPQFSPVAGPQRPKKRRLGLILGISIPLAVLTIGAVLAAFIVPGVIRDQQAQASADAFNAERTPWLQVFSSEALAPYSAIDSSAIFTAYVSSTVPDAATGAAECANVDTLITDAAGFTATAPTLSLVEGGESNQDYAAALALWNTEQNAYAASSTFSATATTELAIVDKVCDYVLGLNAAEAQLDARLAAELTPLQTVANGQVESYTHGNMIADFTCGNASGCVSWLDFNARVNYGTVMASIYTEWANARIDLINTYCPTEDVRALCDAEAEARQLDLDSLLAIASAYQNENPLSNLPSSPGPFVATPALNAAISQLGVNETTSYELVSDQALALGYSSMGAALLNITSQAASRLAAAATASTVGA